MIVQCSVPLPQPNHVDKLYLRQPRLYTTKAETPRTNFAICQLSSIAELSICGSFTQGKKDHRDLKSTDDNANKIDQITIVCFINIDTIPLTD